MDTVSKGQNEQDSVSHRKGVKRLYLQTVSELFLEIQICPQTGIAKQKQEGSASGPKQSIPALEANTDLHTPRPRLYQWERGCDETPQGCSLQEVNPSAVHGNSGTTARVFKEMEALYFLGQKRMPRVCVFYTSQGFNQQADSTVPLSP